MTKAPNQSQHSSDLNTIVEVYAYANAIHPEYSITTNQTYNEHDLTDCNKAKGKEVTIRQTPQNTGYNKLECNIMTGVM